MNAISAICALLLSAYVFVLFTKATNGLSQQPILSVQLVPSKKLLSQNVRVFDLFSIVIALDKFKRENGRYPISPNRGSEWYFYSEKNVSWIPELSPKYINELPRDPRKTRNPLEQYAYKSNGANYKLVAGYPEDCEKVKDEYAELVVRIATGCYGYGFWSSEQSAHW